ncbi:uncharacterized protein LOC117001280 [Catharus ustulatus]|uniref:uncharacterized protein LOC117001280 n=1 Tax=Catharus ustulatus TaxID=91951 RepID=UPI00140890FA|nr:uncharacterized protein LOC117001280 [Catharus ustulatus]
MDSSAASLDTKLLSCFPATAEPEACRGCSRVGCWDSSGGILLPSRAAAVVWGSNTLQSRLVQGQHTQLPWEHTGVGNAIQTPLGAHRSGECHPDTLGAHRSGECHPDTPGSTQEWGMPSRYPGSTQEWGMPSRYAGSTLGVGNAIQIPLGAHRSGECHPDTPGSTLGVGNAIQTPLGAHRSGECHPDTLGAHRSEECHPDPWEHTGVGNAIQICWEHTGSGECHSDTPGSTQEWGMPSSHPWEHTGVGNAIQIPLGAHRSGECHPDTPGRLCPALRNLKQMSAPGIFPGLEQGCVQHSCSKGS